MTGPGDGVSLNLAPANSDHRGQLRARIVMRGARHANRLNRHRHGITVFARGQVDRWNHVVRPDHRVHDQPHR